MEKMKLKDYIRSCLKFRRDRLQSPTVCPTMVAWATPNGDWDAGESFPSSDDVIFSVSWVDPACNAKYILSANEIRCKAREEMLSCIRIDKNFWEEWKGLYTGEFFGDSDEVKEIEAKCAELDAWMKELKKREKKNGQNY